MTQRLDQREVERRLWVAKSLIKQAKLYAEVERNAGAGGEGFGVTVLVHDAELVAGMTQCIASDTTLPDRASVRIVLTEAVCQSLLLDGVTADNVAEMAANDLKNFDQPATKTASEIAAEAWERKRR